MAWSSTPSSGVHSLTLSTLASPAAAAASVHGIAARPGPVTLVAHGHGRRLTDITLNGRRRELVFPLKSGMDLASTAKSGGSFVSSPGPANGPIGFGRTATDVTIGQRHFDRIVDGAGDNSRHAKKRLMFWKRNDGEEQFDSEDRLCSTMGSWKDDYGLRTQVHTGGAASSFDRSLPSRSDREVTASEWRSRSGSSIGRRSAKGKAIPYPDWITGKGVGHVITDVTVDGAGFHDHYANYDGGRDRPRVMERRLAYLNDQIRFARQRGRSEASNDARERRGTRTPDVLVLERSSSSPELKPWR